MNCMLDSNQVNVEYLSPLQAAPVELGEQLVPVELEVVEWASVS